ncbi:MAG TPA: hypothetical protein VEO94_03870, partial [Candidatus Dormibacteraeota bacterium]|nr:hypothetical protein [Candidatus Dormibacteraeota bacterium]
WGKDCGADEYMTKPFSTRDLGKTIDRLLALGRERRAGATGGVLQEYRDRQARGEEGQIVNFDWDPRAMDIFRKKYGEFKLGEAYKKFRAAVEEFLREHKDPGPVELHEVSGLAVVLRGSASQAKDLALQLARRLNDVAGALYAAEDRVRGYIPFRNPRTSQEEKLPLLSFSPRIAPDKAA